MWKLGFGDTFFERSRNNAIESKSSTTMEHVDEPRVDEQNTQENDTVTENYRIVYGIL
jgi:hypothetical protein